MKVEIHLDENQDPLEAEEILYKALNSQRTGEMHSQSAFMDPAMQHQLEHMKSTYDLILKQMVDEIIAVIDDEDVLHGD